MTNTRIIKELNMKESTFYAMKKRKPRFIELIGKGMEYEEVLKSVAKEIKTNE